MLENLLVVCVSIHLLGIKNIKTMLVSQDWCDDWINKYIKVLKTLLWICMFRKNYYCYDYWYLDFGISNIFFDYVKSEKSKSQSDGTS